MREGERLRFPEGYRVCADEIELHKESKSVFAPPDAFASGGVFCTGPLTEQSAAPYNKIREKTRKRLDCKPGSYLILSTTRGKAGWR